MISLRKNKILKHTNSITGDYYEIQIKYDAKNRELLL